MSRPATLGELIQSGYLPRTVRQELRDNVVGRIKANLPIVSGLVGYEETVIPELERALLLGHDIILLGERGQAKTRIIRSLVELLDEWIPCVTGSELNESPFNPILASTKSLIGDKGDATPISWIPRERRLNEKLATPDTSIADLIGEVDPIKVAQGRYLSDIDTLHFGLVPRSNRGIFAINELPDLPERIQVGLLSVLEERDVQVRGYAISLPLDILFIASANPEDYTSRGRLITPLKDRFGAQIRTHYPRNVQDEIKVITQEARLPDFDVAVPEIVTEIIATTALLARHHPSISSYSGVSVRASISGYESVVASAIIRALRTSDATPGVRVDDLEALRASFMGKIEFDVNEAKDEEKVFSSLVNQAISRVFSAHYASTDLGGVVTSVEEEPITLDSLAPTDSLAKVAERPQLHQVIPAGSVPDRIAHLELILEGLYLSRKIGRSTSSHEARYQER